jgi:hypothetical protein
MSETDRPITQKQNSLIWGGLPIVRKLTGWMTVALLQVRERNGHIFVLGHSLTASQILKSQ